MKSEIISGIIDIEEQAVKITKDAVSRLKNLPAEINEKQNRIEKHLKQEYDGRIKKTTEKIDRELDEKLSEIARLMEKSLRAMDNNFQENHLSWENEMFKQVVR